MPDLALGDQLPDGPGHVLHRHVGIDAVLVEEVDAVGAQPLERGFEDRADLLGPAIQAAGTGAVQVEAELGGDHHLVADGLERLADHFFILVGAIDLGGIEEGDAAVERGADHLHPLRRFEGLSVGLADAHAAQADRRDFKAVAEFARLHPVHSELICGRNIANAYSCD